MKLHQRLDQEAASLWAERDVNVVERELERLQEEAAWIRRKLKLPTQPPCPTDTESLWSDEE